MRHRKRKINKLGRTTAQREALLSHLVCNLIIAGRIKTTLAKAKAARRMADRMVTLGKKNTLASRRLAIARLRRKDVVKDLFDNVAPAFTDRAGGYTRILKLGQRVSDSSEMALLEWVNHTPKAPKVKKAKAEEQPAAAAAPAAEEKKPKARRKKKAAEETAEKA
jgi:large subunit ribosomal protein L17